MKFVVDKNIPLAEEAFNALGDVVRLGTADITADSVRNADILIVRSETKVNQSLLQGSSVRFIGTATIGTDHIDTDYLKSSGIDFASAPGCNSNSVKEYIVAALLHLAQEKKFSLKGKSIGVVGVGNVGSKVIDAATALGMSVLQNDPPRARKEGNAHFHSLDELMDADIITLHTPLTKIGDDLTYHLFDAQQINKIKKGAIVINSSRGAVVDTPALKKAIQDRQLSTAILDVWENEPTIDTTLLPLITLGTPHIAGYSLEGKINGTTMIRTAVCKHLGIDPSWDHLQHIPKPAVTTVHAPDNLNSADEVLSYVVRQCYDIVYDNEILQRMIAMPTNEQGIYFRGLRSGYRVRREFSNVTVQLGKSHAKYQFIITALGFKCKMVE